MSETKLRHVGRSVEKVDGLSLATGRAEFTAEGHGRHGASFALETASGSSPP